MRTAQAQVTVKLPENLTTWVADARAATVDGHVGQATRNWSAPSRCFVELQTPRFFVAGDQARVGAVVHNNGRRSRSTSGCQPRGAGSAVDHAGRAVGGRCREKPGVCHLGSERQRGCAARGPDRAGRQRIVPGFEQAGARHAVRSRASRSTPIARWKPWAPPACSPRPTRPPKASSCPLRTTISDAQLSDRRLALAGGLDAGQPDLSEGLSLHVHGADHLELPAERGHHARPQAGRPARTRPCRATSISR